MEIWLTHLQQSQEDEEHMGTLLRFLDEVFTAVAAEPYVYSDIIIDIQAGAVAAEASVAQSGMDLSQWNTSSDTRYVLTCVNSIWNQAISYYTFLHNNTHEKITRF